ncbi:MAG TPA: DUF2970 domain-containing protein [Rubrivivax sp.]|nr:DUF2970 domain-containing protein [Burkholderiales bacterium]HNT38534.1 DUF2970 domain-containing protein [Rubrivivax sp.]
MTAPPPLGGQLPPRKATALEALRAVVWSFCGIRGGAAYEQDVQRLSPLQVIAAGIVAALAFIGALVLLVRWVVGSGVAG